MNILEKVVNRYECLEGRTSKIFSNDRKNFRQNFSITGKLREADIIQYAGILGMISFIAFVLPEVGTKAKIACIIMSVMSIFSITIKNTMLRKILEGKPTNINIYQRELPSKLRPAHVRMLIHDGKIDRISLYATLLDLIERGYIEISNGKLPLTKNIYDYKQKSLTLKKTDKNDKDLLMYEKYVIEWFIEKYGANGEVRAEGIHYNLKSNNFSERPYELFIEWQALVLTSFPFYKFYCKLTNNRMQLIYFLLILVGIYNHAVGVITNSIDNIVYAWPIILYAFVNMEHCSSFCAMTKCGKDECDKWLDLKKYLVDFSNIKNKGIEMLEIWDFYLTYAVVFEIGNTTKRQIEKFIGNSIYTHYNKQGVNLNERMIMRFKNELPTNFDIDRIINSELRKYDLDI